MLFHRHHPKARTIEWVYITLLLLFTCILYARPSVGMAGIGAVGVISALQVLGNKDVIWANYKKNWKKSKDATRNKLTKPNEAVYRWNVRVIWPFILFASIALIALSIVSF